MGPSAAMRIKVLAWSVVTLAAVALAIWAAAYAWLFSQEDYAPKPGTLAYYVGMSSLVRHAPVANAAGAPDYFGSVGDGDKGAAFRGVLRGVAWQRR